jgi:hypothetical protein
MKVMFVHGRAQNGRSASEIGFEWSSALHVGLRSAGFSDLVVQPVVPFYGDVLAALAEGEPGDADEFLRGDGDVGFERFVAQYASEAVAALGISQEELERHSGRASSDDEGLRGGGDDARGISNWPWVIAAVRAIDTRWPRLSAGGIRALLSDVYIYLTKPEVRAEIDNIVLDRLDSDAYLVVGHSLGSVVAYNVLSAASRGRSMHFVTVGSPLGITAVRDLLPKAPHIPEAVKSWYNAYDARDIVALNPLRAPFFQTVPEIDNNSAVNNDSDNHHHIKPYLSNSDVARAIGNCLNPKGC